MSERIAFLGIGLMGAPMAERLIAAGRDVVLWNRTPAKAEAVAGARVTKTPAEAAASARNAMLIARILGPDSDSVRRTVIAALGVLREDRLLPRVWLC